MKKRPLPILVFASVLYLLLAQGCGGVSSSSASGTTSSPSTTGQVVTNNPDTPLSSWSQIQGKSNVSAIMRVNDQGTTVTEIPCTIQSATTTTVDLDGVSESNVEDLHCIPGNSRPVYQGDSGTPIVVNGDIGGGLFGSNNGVQFDARFIQQEMATQSGPAIARPSTSRASGRITPQWYFEGPSVVYEYLIKQPGFQHTIHSGQQPASLKAPIASGSSVAPIPGLRFASPFVYGPYAVGYDAATYTMELSNGDWIGTAHGLEDAGAVSWPVTSFYVTGFQNGAVSGYILGPVFGTLLWDGQDGSVINPNAAAAMMPVVVSTTLNLLPEGAVTSQVRFDLGSATEDEGIVAAVQSTAAAQIGNTANSVSGSGSITLKVGGTSITHNLSFGSGESATSFINSLGAQVQSVLVTQHDSAPSEQIQQVQVSLSISD